MESIGFLGGGNMAEALLKGILEAGLYRPEAVWVSDVRDVRLEQLKERYGVQVTPDNRALVSRVRVLVLSVKPQVMMDVLDGIAGSVQAGTLVISIAAGVRTDSIRSKLGEVQIVRVMPNTPALAGSGVSGLYSAGASRESMQTALKIFSSVGKAIEVGEEITLTVP